MPVTINGTTGITTPTYNGSTTAEYLVPVTGFKNRIINGDMTIDQRNAGAAITASGFPVDRFGSAFSTDGAFSAQQDSSAPAGFTTSVKCTTTTADASLSASQYWFFRQRIEGYNVADLGFGTASAKTITLSFWVRSSLTGTFSGAILNGDTNRSYPFNYTISAANTWEQKSVTIAGDTSGTWNKTNGNGMVVAWSLGIGSNFQGTANAWGASEAYGTAGSVSVIGTTSATWYITGVQLEVGSNATSFDYLPYGTELALCQRYFYRNSPPSAYTSYMSGSADTTSSVFLRCDLPTTMRSSPTFALSDLELYTSGGGLSIGAVTNRSNLNSGSILMVTTGAVAGRGVRLEATGTFGTVGYIEFSAEL